MNETDPAHKITDRPATLGADTIEAAASSASTARLRRFGMGKDMTYFLISCGCRWDAGSQAFCDAANSLLTRGSSSQVSMPGAAIMQRRGTHPIARMRPSQGAIGPRHHRFKQHLTTGLSFLRHDAFGLIM